MYVCYICHVRLCKHEQTTQLVKSRMTTKLSKSDIKNKKTKNLEKWNKELTRRNMGQSGRPAEAIPHRGVSDRNVTASASCDDLLGLLSAK